MSNFNIIRKSINFAGKELTIETGRMAKQANGSVFITCGETSLLCTATAKKEVSEGQKFFPLTVDFEEKFYAAGKIPGGFFKREGRPSTFATLTSRVIDRSIRPLFPKGFFNNVHVVVSVLSYDHKQDLGSLGIIGASAALTISDIPFKGPIAAISMGVIDGRVIKNLALDDECISDLELSVAGSEESIVMIEAGANEISESKFLDAIYDGHEEIKKLCRFQNELQAEAGKETMEYEVSVVPEEIVEKIRADYTEKIKETFEIKEKLKRNEAVNALKKEIEEKIAEEHKDDDDLDKLISDHKGAFDEVFKDVMRTRIVKEHKRVDGRGLDEIRQLTLETDILARAHGSALFTRGETQSLGVVTLGTASDEQIIDGLGDEYRKDYYLHYNFPPFSVGEAGFMRGPGRREIGHGMLAETAIRPVLPKKDEFPYTIRIVSDILESNGSSSMATVCSGILSLMNAGVPIKKPVAGIANGLIMEGDDFVVLTDIQGMEDHEGDMDFKVTGTRDGITAMQMDIKIDGISRDIMELALSKAKDARYFILDKYEELDIDKDKLSKYAPRIESISIKDKDIPVIIGKGGSTIKSIIEETGVDIDISEETKEVTIASPDGESIERAKEIIKNLIATPERGEVYDGEVTRVEKYGAFVKFMGNKSGLVHVSNMAERHVKHPENIVKVGDKIKVRFTGLNKGKINLSMKGLNK